MTFPIGAQWTANERVTAVKMVARVDAQLNLLGINYALWQAPTVFIGAQATPQTLTTGTTVAPITLDTEIIDTYLGHSTSSNTSRYVVPAVLNGLRLRYFGLVNYASNGTGARVARITQNSVLVPGANTTQATVVTATGPAYQVYGSSIVATGDIIELNGAQTSGGNLATVAGSQLEIVFGGAV